MNPSLAAKAYSVRPGDNLSAIAKSHGYRDWTVVYKSRCNRKLRELRPDPNLILPGDTVMLPPRVADIRAALDRLS